MKKSIVLATAVASVLSSNVVLAELSGNAGIFSNYIWRGITQTNDQAAGQGGLDWSHDSGLYVGTWVSNVAFGNSSSGGYEMDIYAGYAGEVGGLGYDVGVLTYQYPVSPNINFTEVYASGTVGILTVGAAFTVDAASGNTDAPFDDGDLYVNASLDFASGDRDISIYAGTYMFDADGNPGVGDADYSHYGASISKDGFTFAIDKNDVDEGEFFALSDGTSDNVRFTVSYSVDFAL